MDGELIFKVAVLSCTILLAALGYIVGVLKMIHNKSDTTVRDLAAHRVEMARDYVQRSEMNQVVQNLEHRFDKIDQRFDKMEQWIGRRFDMVLGRSPSDTAEK
jgi:uncharacterized protein HemX